MAALIVPTHSSTSHRKNQQDWSDDKIDVVVATIA
jgi:superfamily II DNA helicase RecQ